MKEGKGKLARLWNMVVDLFTDVTSHWKKPSKNNYVPYSEVINYSVGGMGVQCLIYVMGFLGLGAGNTLLGSTIGIRPMHLQLMATIQGVLGIAFPIIRGKMVDNTRTKYGRFRPYIALSGLPLLIMCSIYIWLPFESMTYTNKLIVTMCFTICISFVTPLFTDTYGELGSCLTPNTAERTNIFTVSSLIYSFAPTVYYTAVPMLSNLTGGMTDIRTYKYIIIPVGIIGVALSFFTAFGCKERVISSKNYVQKVGLIEGIKAVLSNKYWWIRTLATLLGFMEMASSVIFGWIYIYGTQDMITFGILNTIWGTASGLSMLCTPWILKKLGNRRTLLFHNSANVIFTTFMLFTFRLPWLYFIFMYINTFFNQLQIVYNPVLAAEVKDSIQYNSGKRLDFTLGAAWILLAPIQMATGFVLPYINECMGLTVNYDVLYDPVVRNNLFSALCICSIVGAALNLVPFFFYKLSREKHNMIIFALKFRAVNSDYALNKTNCYQIRDVVDMYNSAEQAHTSADVDVKALRKAYFAVLCEKAVTDDIKSSDEYKDKTKRKQLIKTAKLEHKAKVKEAYRAYKDGETLMENKAAYDEVFAPELVKYDTPFNRVKYEICMRIKSVDLDDIKRTSLDFSDIKYDDASDKEAKKIAKLIAKMTALYGKMQRLAIAKYSDVTLRNNYWEELEKAIDAPATTKEEKKQHDKCVKEKEKALKLFHKQFKCWNDAIAFVLDKDSSTNFFEYILPMYDEATLECDRLDREQKEKDDSEKQERKDELDNIKLAKVNKKRVHKGLEPLSLEQFRGEKEESEQ